MMKITDRIRIASKSAPLEFPKKATVACQGTEGAYSQFACERLFSEPGIMFLESFDGVFNAVDKGMCEYGVLPIENSWHGSVAEVYDLMRKYGFYIIRSVRIKINHALLANEGVIPPQLKEIYSHEQALWQCGDFIKKLRDVKVVSCANTAAAARMVADSGRRDIAAIANPSCADLYGLSVISRNIQNDDKNRTRFICVSKELSLFPGADRLSVMFTVPHKPGALYGYLAKFAELGVNLTKLESRPRPGRDFDYMFYVDMEASCRSEAMLNLFEELDGAPETFAFMGGYSEIGE
jgi:chorismate mutase/prephenate dehydratase